MRTIYTITIMLVMSISSMLAQHVYYVDKNNSTCSDTNVGDASNPWCTINKANQILEAGDTVYIKAGTYLDDGIAPINSGLPDQYIVYKTWQNDSVNISKNVTNLDAINIESRSYILVDGFTVTNIRKYLMGSNASCHHNIIQNNYFSGASSFSVMRFIGGCTYNKILNNHFEDGGDHVTFEDSDYNLLEGNEFYNASHANFAIRCGNFNVIRNNYFFNSTQKIGEVYDCDATSTYNATKYNLIEGNRFAYTPSSGNSSPFAGIQYAGQNGIIRKNMFYDNVGGGLRLALYGTEANYNTNNRVYNNVFYNNRHAGIEAAAGELGYIIDDNVFKNNIFYQNYFETNDTRWPWWVDDLDKRRVQIKFTEPDGGMYFERNNIYHSFVGDDEVIVYGNRSPGMTPPYNTLTWWQSNYILMFVNNIEFDPKFVDAANYDFHLDTGSPMIDAGAFLTKTVGSGSGSTMIVEDAGYFFDGFTISGEVGDTIQLDGQTQWAIITHIDYSTNTIKLNTSLTWSDNQMLGLKYKSMQPDMGAFEYSPLTSAPKTDNKQTLNVFPNPFTGQFTITTVLEKTETVKIKIMNVLGEVVYQENEQASAGDYVKQINIMQLPKAVYLLQLYTGNQTITQKLIKQ